MVITPLHQVTEEEAAKDAEPSLAMAAADICWIFNGYLMDIHWVYNGFLVIFWWIVGGYGKRN